MIKGTTKVGEIFYSGKETLGSLKVLPVYLGTAISGFGGGNSQFYVIEEEESFLGAIRPLDPVQDTQKPFRNNTHDGHRPTGRKQQALAHQKFGMTPFDQQNTQNLQGNFAIIDQKIEERESLRHSTHRSQRSERIAASQQQHANQTGVQYHGGFAGVNFGMNAQNNVTASDNFEQTDYNVSEKSQNHRVNVAGQTNEENDEFGYENTNIDVNQQAEIQTSSRMRMQNQFQQNSTNANVQVQQKQQHNIVGHISQISCGEGHILNLTRNGNVFTQGTGQYCNTGLGGSISSNQLSLLKSLNDKKVIQIACGSNHSLVLTDQGYLYTWGRGFEGQLGLSETIEVASVPQYLKFFHNKFVSYVSAGAFYSLAVTNKGEMYSWGEAKMGQLGLGRYREVRTPRQIEFPKNVQIRQCAAGYGHTVALTDTGSLYSWGFNTYGQVGLGDKKTHWSPEQITSDVDGNEMSPIIKVVCQNYATIAIDNKGQPFSWGKGFIGHQAESKSDMPCPIIHNTQNRIFTDVFANGDAVLLFAPVRIYEIEPKCGPAKGGTQIKITGTGFTNSEKLSVRFNYGEASSEVSCYFENGDLICRTPSFFQAGEEGNITLPLDCFISVTLDGLNYSECEQSFKIYSNQIYLNALNPKCGSVIGGSQVTLSIEIDNQTSQFLQNLKIGFQQKAKKLHSDSSKAKLKDKQLPVVSDDVWITAEGFYENGCIIATVPQIKNSEVESMVYSVDVALNGQQFTGKPINFRYYDVTIDKIEPDFGPQLGGTSVYICGQGLYDATIKKVKFTTDDLSGQREVNAEWDAAKKAFKVTVPPFQWLFADEELTDANIKQLQIKAQKPIQLSLSLNDQEWIKALQYKYHDAKVVRLAYVQVEAPELQKAPNAVPQLSAEDKERIWNQEEAEDIGYPEGLSEEEIKKKEDEAAKKANEETEESSTVAKRRGARMYIYGTGFIKNQHLMVRMTQNGLVHKFVKPVYKTSKKLAIEIPDMGVEVDIGNHQLVVEVTVNGQQFSQNGITFLYQHVDPNMTDEELKRLEEEELKALKKGGAKKK